MLPCRGTAVEARGFEHFFYGDVREKAKSTAVDLISVQFEQMRENLNWKEPVTDRMPTPVCGKEKISSCTEDLALVSSVTTPTVKRGKAETTEHRPEFVVICGAHGGKHSPVPSHIVPKRAAHSQAPSQVKAASPHRARPRSADSRSVRRELYLHHDMFLTSQDADVEQVLLHHLHPHAANHPEQEHRPVREVPHARPTGQKLPAAGAAGKVALSPSQSEKGTGSSVSVQPSAKSPGSASKGMKTVQDKAGGSPPSAGTERAPNPHVQFPERPELVRTLGSSHSLADLLEQEGKKKPVAAIPSPPLHTFRGVRAVSADKLRGDLHLHHDVFLRSEDDDVVSAVRSISRRRQEAVSRYPHQSDEQVDYALKPDVRGARCVVPSHVVKPRDTAASALRAQKVVDAIRSRSVRGGGGTDRGARSLSPTCTRNSPETGGRTAASTEQSLAVAPSPSVKKTDKAASLLVVPFHGDKADGVRQVISPTTVAESPSVSAAAASPGGPSASMALKKKKQNQKQFNFQSRTDSARTIDGGAATPPQTAVKRTQASLRAEMKAAASPAAVVAVPRPQQQQPPKQHYQRPLTAAEHAAALALSSKLTAANLARMRDADAGPHVEPRRQMSRALSLLVYNVRAEDCQTSV